MPKTDKLLDVFVGIGQFALQLIAAPAFNKCEVHDDLNRRGAC